MLFNLGIWMSFGGVLGLFFLGYVIEKRHLVFSGTVTHPPSRGINFLNESLGGC